MKMMAKQNSLCLRHQESLFHSHSHKTLRHILVDYSFCWNDKHNGHNVSEVMGIGKETLSQGASKDNIEQNL